MNTKAARPITPAEFKKIVNASSPTELVDSYARSDEAYSEFHASYVVDEDDYDNRMDSQEFGEWLDALMDLVNEQLERLSEATGRSYGATAYGTEAWIKIDGGATSSDRVTISDEIWHVDTDVDFRTIDADLIEEYERWYADQVADQD